MGEPSTGYMKAESSQHIDQVTTSSSSVVTGITTAHQEHGFDGSLNGHTEMLSNIDRILQSRYNIVSSAFLECDSLNDVVIDDVTESEPTSAMLSYCKKRFMLPYVHVLGLVGLRPMTIDAPDWSAWIGHIQTLIIITLLLIGYILEYLASFRRDRGTVSNITDIAGPPAETSNQMYLLLNNFGAYKPAIVIGETTFVYAIPSLIHLCGFLMAVYVYRVADNEYLQNLVERVFILHHRPRRLLIVLWAFLVFGIAWVALTTSVIFQEIHSKDEIRFKWLEHFESEKLRWMKILLVSSICTHDIIQMVIMTSYAIQCYLLRSYLYILKEKLLQNTIEPLAWMREICEFRALLHHLNKCTGKPICFFAVLNLIYTFAGVIYTFQGYTNYGSSPIKVFSLNIGNILLWLIASLFPFFQAATLTLACESAQTCGHQVRIRPFVHHNTSSEDLNSVLLYASSLRMSAKLFRMPIQGNYIFFIILSLLLVVLTLGMCLKVSLGIV